MNTNQPDYKSPEYQKAANRWQKISDLLADAEALRNETYLPKYPLEHSDKHKVRMQMADLLPAFEDAIDACVGLAFRDEPKLSDDVPVEIRGDEESNVEGWWENIDLAGTHGNEFFKEAFQMALEFGHAVVLVDNQPALDSMASPADERAQGRRPYCVLYHPERVLNPFFVIEDGKVICDQITFEEVVTERDGLYGQKKVYQYRTFYRENGIVNWRLERKEKDGDKESFALIGKPGSTGLKVIPFAVVYGKKTGHLQSMPPFWNLAELNLSHWRQMSDYRNNVAHNQFNLLAVIGKNDKEPLPLGPSGQINVPTGGDAKFIAPSPDGPAIALESLKQTERAMAQAGFAIVADESGQAKTAKEVTIDHSRKTSKLSKAVKSLKDCIETCLGFMAEYENLGSGGSITIGGDVDDLAVDPQLLDVFLRAVDSGNLTRETWLQIIAGNVSKIVETYDPMAEAEELKKQAENVLEGMQSNQGGSNEPSQTAAAA